MGVVTHRLDFEANLGFKCAVVVEQVARPLYEGGKGDGEQHLLECAAVGDEFQPLAIGVSC